MARVMFREDIQALRGVAVLAVMLAHFGGLLPGGFLGVDIFFAISGFVIALSFIQHFSETKSKWALLREFWLRRFFRLFPTLTAVLSVTLIASFFVLPAEDFYDQRDMGIWSYFFLGNVGVEVVSNEDYFDPAASENWLLHLWSLGVEEQFYLLFPFLMIPIIGWLGQPRRHQLAIWSVGVGILASFSIACVNDIGATLSENVIPTLNTTGIAAITGYYSPLTRAWQFGIGVLAAIGTYIWPNYGEFKILRILGLLILTVSFLVVPESNLLPGPWTLLPMLAMFIVLFFRPTFQGKPNSVSALLKWLGDRSYSAYLWHWPVWSFLTRIDVSVATSIFLSFALTLALASASYRWVERPFRWQSGSNISLKQRSPVGVASFERTWLSILFSLPVVFVAAIAILDGVLRGSGIVAQRLEVPRIPENLDCIESACSPEDVDVFLVGDSHAGALAESLYLELNSRDLEMRGAIMARASGCLHLPSSRITSYSAECQALSELIREQITAFEPDTVIYFGYTAGRFTDINSGGRQAISLVDNFGGKEITEAGATSAYELALSESVEIALASGAHVIVVSGTPDFTLRPEEVGRDGDASSLFETLVAPFTGETFGQSVSKEDFLKRHEPFRLVEARVVEQHPGVEWMDPWEVVCDHTLCSQIDESGTPLYSDQDHLSATGARILAKGISERFFENSSPLVAEFPGIEEK